MPKKVLMLSVIVLLTFYASYAKNYVNSFILEKVDRTPALEGQPETDGKRAYKDPLIQVKWDPDPRGFHFKLSNLSAQNISIVWNECFIFDFISKYTIVHSNIRDIREQPPTTLAPNDEISDFLYPAAFVPYRHGKYSGLRLKEMYDPDVPEKAITANEYTPRKFTLTVTITTATESFKYEFRFITQAVEETRP